LRYYPIYLDLAGERAVVIGTDQLADEKVALLREGGAVVERLAAADYRDGILAGARIVIDASGDLDVNARVWAAAEAAGILVNVVDRTHQCRFIAPAIVRRDPLLIAISTEGESPFLASTLRQRLEIWLGSEWGPFTALVGRIRRTLRGRGVPLPDQTAAYRRLLNSDVRDLLRDGRTAEAEFAAAAIASSAGQPRPGRVALVGAGPGDPGLLTVRGQELLAGADVVFHDALISPGLLKQIPRGAELVDVGKRGGRRSARQDDITAALIKAARAGREVVRLKGGDPFVFGRGGEELEALLGAGLEVIVVPGVSAAVAAPAAAGIPLTMRGISASVAFATATGADADIPERLLELAAAADTLVLLMPLGVLDDLAARLAAALGPDRPAALVSNATLPDQRVARGRLRDIASVARASGIESPATLVVGEVVNAVQLPAVRASSPRRAGGGRWGA
jgi:uroporphyrin-III C-methyltransferase/precorrin-2 dehydrogenase/sirohydrochlorin ferrochelatase